MKYILWDVIELLKGKKSNEVAINGVKVVFKVGSPKLCSLLTISLAHKLKPGDANTQPNQKLHVRMLQLDVPDWSEGRICSDWVSDCLLASFIFSVTVSVEKS